MDAWLCECVCVCVCRDVQDCDDKEGLLQLVVDVPGLESM